ncbi:MAG: hypothetical protein R2706_12995 [Acidimicrobiales bacterium]
MFTGTALETASYSNPSGIEWQVDPVFKEGADGIDLFNSAAALAWRKRGVPDGPTCHGARSRGLVGPGDSERQSRP